MKALYRLFASLLIVFYAALSVLPLTAFAQTAAPAALTATPFTGTLPLAVTFKGDTGAGCGGGNFTLTYGDGKSFALAQPADACKSGFSITHTYTTAGAFTAQLSANSTVIKTTKVTVSAPPAQNAKPTCQILLNTSSISVGGSVTVKWTSTSATGGAITNIGNVGPTGSINLLPSSAAVTTYYGAFTGPGGTTNCQASVAVNSVGGTGGTVTNANGTVIQTTPTTPAVPTPAPTGVSSGLVPCGYGAFNASNSSDSSTGCQACNLAQLIQNLMTFAIGIAIPIAAALFAYAGFLYITSATNPGNIGKAKGIFKDALIGFLIAITAWLVINTLLHVIFSQGTFASGNWFTIQCATGQVRPVNGKITDVLSQLPIVAGNIGAIQPDGSGSGVSTNGTPSGGGASGSSGGGSNTSTAAMDAAQDALQDACEEQNDQFSCSALGDGVVGKSLTTAQQDALGDLCFEGNTSSCTALDNALAAGTVNLSGNSGAGTAQWAAQLAQACQNANLSTNDCKLAQAIMANESSGRPGIISPVGAAGLMQVMPGTARGLDPANLSGLSDAQITQKLTNDPAYNMQLGTQYIAQLAHQFNDDPSLIAAAYNGGAKANNTSSSCGGGTVWQCTANSGYAETRVYVPRVISTYNSLK